MNVDYAEYKGGNMSRNVFNYFDKNYKHKAEGA